MRAVLDTNVLVSAVMFGGLPGRILEGLLRGEFEAVTTARLMDEFQDVLIEVGLSPEIAATARADYEQLAVVVAPERLPSIARDPDDNEVLAAAAMGRVAVIVTGDRDLLALAEHGAIAIVTVRRFADELPRRR